MKALQGGKAKNEKIDAHTLAGLLRGGMLPQASGYPAQMRATRDLLRRRCHLLRKRAELLAPSEQTPSPSKLPELGKQLASKATRAGVEAHCPHPSVRTTLAVEVSLSDPSDQVVSAVDLYMTRTAKAPDVQTCSRLPSLPGSGKMLALGIWYAIQDRARFPRGQDFVSSCPLVQGAKESGGKRLGTAGKKLGTGPLRWAVAEAAVLF